MHVHIKGNMVIMTFFSNKFITSIQELFVITTIFVKYSYKRDGCSINYELISKEIINISNNLKINLYFSLKK